MLRRAIPLLPVLLCLGVVAASAATVKVRVDKTAMRVSPSPKADVVLELRAGALLELIDFERDWYKVRDPETKKEGYVPAAAADLLPGPAPQAGGQKPAAGAKPAAKPAGPPKKGEWVDTGYLSVNGLFEGGSSAFTQTQSWQSFGENASVSVQYPAKSAPGFDVEAGFRLWRNMAVGLGITSVSRSTTTTVSGSLPNPIYLNRPNSLSGGFASTNGELGLHLQASWVVPMPPKMQLMIFGGPSVFNVKQTVVDPQGISLPMIYPYESGVISSAKTTDASATAVGFGLGADFTYYLTRTIGVGGLVRYARASVSIPVSGQPSVDFDAGGFQAGAGLRIRIPSKRTPKPAPKPPAKPATPKPTKPDAPVKK